MGTLLGHPLIWDMPAWLHCSGHPRSGEQHHHQILAVPTPAHATHDTGSPTPEHRHRSTAPHTMFPASCCPQAGLSDSVSLIFKGGYTPAALGRQFWCREGGRGQAVCVTYIPASIHPTVLLGKREGGLLRKEKSLSRGTGRKKGLTWAWEQCSASQLMSVQLPWPLHSHPRAPGIPPASLPAQGRGFHHCSPTAFQGGWKLEVCGSLPGHRSCPPCYSFACSLPSRRGSTHEHPKSSRVSPHAL